MLRCKTMRVVRLVSQTKKGEMHHGRNNKKMYILDTNVLMHDPHSMLSFGDSTVGIPAVVIEELDKFKREGTDRGRNSREAVRFLDSLRERGSLREGVSLENGGMLRVLFSERLPSITEFPLELNDNKILLTALGMKHQGYAVKFISKDLNARVKADAIGVFAEDYLKEYVSEEEFYKGWTRLQVPAIQLKREIPVELEAFAHDAKLEVNEFVLVESQNNPYNYRVFRYLGGSHFRPVYDPQIKWPLKARNAQQLMALDLLFDDEIKLVCLLGPAGTGKTFLALLAGLHKVVVMMIMIKF